MKFTDYTTDSKEINWLIARVTVHDYSNQDGKYFIGEFKGTIPFYMKEKIIKYFGGVTASFTGKIVETEQEEVSYSVEFGKHKSNTNTIKFYISYYGD